jgi:flagellar biosynthesis protein FlhB
VTHFSTEIYRLTSKSTTGCTTVVGVVVVVVLVVLLLPGLILFIILSIELQYTIYLQSFRQTNKNAVLYCYNIVILSCFIVVVVISNRCILSLLLLSVVNIECRKKKLNDEHVFYFYKSIFGCQTIYTYIQKIKES